MGFGPSPLGPQRTQIDVLYVKGLVDTVSVRNGRYRAADPSFVVHVIVKFRPYQSVPKVLVPFAVLGNHLEWHAGLCLQIDHVSIAFGMRVQGLRERAERIDLGQTRGI